MAQTEESWDPVAKTLGFESEGEMLKYFYVQERRSIKEIAKVVGFAAWTVRRRIQHLEIPLRSRGGPNHSGKRKLAHVSDADLAGNPVKLAIKHNVHISTVFSERRIRQWSSALSALQTSSKDLREEATHISSLPSVIGEMPPMPSGTGEELGGVIQSFSITEPTKES